MFSEVVCVFVFDFQASYPNVVLKRLRSFQSRFCWKWLNMRCRRATASAPSTRSCELLMIWVIEWWVSEGWLLMCSFCFQTPCQRQAVLRDAQTRAIPAGLTEAEDAAWPEKHLCLNRWGHTPLFKKTCTHCFCLPTSSH